MVVKADNDNLRLRRQRYVAHAMKCLFLIMIVVTLNVGQLVTH